MGKSSSINAGWTDLERELEAWEANAQVATLWWRDDDTVCASAALSALLDLADGIPLSLAVIPGLLTDDGAEGLRQTLAARPRVSAMQHGWMHINHATSDEKKMELGAHRPAAQIMAELAAGWHRLVAQLGRLALPILTPPWNRIAATLLPLLRPAGYVGVSTLGARAAADPCPGLRQVNVHVDLTAWPERRFVGTSVALGRMVTHLIARRTGVADRAEPTGILSHHLIQDGATAAFLGRLLAVTRGHKGARWIGAAEAFAAP